MSAGVRRIRPAGLVVGAGPIGCALVVVSIGLAMQLVPVAAAEAPVVSYLTPERYGVNVGDEVKLHMDRGTALAARAGDWPGDRLSWFFVRAEGTQENRDSITPAAGQQDQAVRVRIAEPGVTMIGLNLKPVVSTFAGADLQAFLSRTVAKADENEGVKRLAGANAVRVRRVESATTLVRAARPDGKVWHSAVAQSKTGQAAEIQPLFDPTMLTVGSDLAVRCFLHGVPQKGARVQATSVSGGVQVASITDSAAAAHIPITHTGVWRIEFHVAEALTADAQADWVVHTATLTFEVPGEKEGARK